MSKISITPNASGTGVFTISSPATNTDRTLTLPDEAGTVLTSASSLTSANLTGTVTVSGSNVGIGTASPTNGKLEVTHSSSTVPAGFFRNTSGSGNSPALTVQGGANNAAANFSVLDYNGNTDFVVQGAGNVGIGTSSPSYLTELYGNGGGDTVTLALTNAGSHPVRLRLNSGHGNWSVGNSITVGDALEFRDESASATRMMINSSGNVLVGTTSAVAGEKLSVQGTGVGLSVGYGAGSAAYRHMYMNSGDGALYFFNPTNYANLSAAGAWTNASDARLKKNIVDIKYGLSEVLLTQPRSYKMNDVEGDFVGFIAQELQPVIPEVVSGDPEKQLSVDYGSLVAVAFKAIQEQQAIITAQQTTIEAMKIRLAALEAV
jgi:hypothetical protein